jgi:hypothetical protein
MFAAWITFSAFRDGAAPVVQIEVLLRANDPMYEVAMASSATGRRTPSGWRRCTTWRGGSGVGAKATLTDLRRPEAPVEEREEHPPQRGDPLGSLDRHPPAPLVSVAAAGVIDGGGARSADER